MRLVSQVAQILKNQGIKYVAFRATYEVKRKLGLLKRSFPSSPLVQKYISFDEWKSLNVPFIVGKKSECKIPKRPNEKLEDRFNKIKAGKICYFNREWKDAVDWFINPDSHFKYDISKHWTEIEDIQSTAGDIKYVWEKSRFSYLYDIIRYDHHFDQDNSKLVFNAIEDWLEANPLNMGPNYKCSQETSLRCLNWIFALYFYQDSEEITESRWQKIMHSIHWQIKHVFANIDFSRICVRNNHAITECMMIYFGGLLFPFLSESVKWKREGKHWLEEEIAYQVYEDGTFLQFSHNYQRVLIQLLSWAISLSEIHEEKLLPTTISRAIKIVEYMHCCCVGQDGQMPNYGSNDGALFFKFNDSDYTDFRPQINALYSVLTLKHLYNNYKIQEDSYWICQNLSRDHDLNIILKKEPISTFEKGGIYSIQDELDKSFTFFKCTGYKDRPAHADNMHLDIWIDGVNYLRDSGTYKYNTEKHLINYFSGTKGHNSVMINDENQMIKGPRFIWYNWTKQTESNVDEQKETFTLSGKAKLFPSLAKGKGLWHRREVVKEKGELNWTIKDVVEDKEPNDELNQIWHPHPDFLDFISMSAFDAEGNEIKKSEEKGYWSAYYGDKTEVPIWVFSTRTQGITTKFKIRL